MTITKKKQSSNSSPDLLPQSILTGRPHTVLTILFLLGVWILFHPYSGIIHDSRLYVAGALHILNPDVFKEDLFFRYGSQNDYTVFPSLLAVLIKNFGSVTATAMIVAFGQALWFGAAIALALYLAPDRPAAIAAMLILAVLPGYYGGWQTLSIAETFATPRLLSEAFVLWAIFFLIHNRRLIALTCIIIAALLHPLIAASAIFFAYILLACRKWPWAFIGVIAALLIILLAYFKIPPFTALSRTMDPAWLAVIEQRNIYLFPTLWTSLDWSRLIMTLGMSMAASIVLTGFRRRLLLSGALGGILGLLMTWVGADILHTPLLIQIQPYRMLWLTCVLAYLGVGILLLMLYRLKEDGHALIMFVGAAWLLSLIPHPAIGAIVFLISLTVAAARIKGWMGPLSRPAQGLAVLLFFIVFAILLLYIGSVLRTASYVVQNPHVIFDLFNKNIFVITVIVSALSIVCARMFPAFSGRLFPLAVLFLALLSLASWDRRTQWTKTLTEASPLHKFDRLLSPGAQIYWENDVRGAWLLLRRPSYISFAQGAGNAFNRQTALTFQERAKAVSTLTNKNLIDFYREKKQLCSALPPLSRTQIVSTCERNPSLDAIVLSRKVDNAYAAVWKLRFPKYNLEALQRGIFLSPVDRFYLYRCDDLITSSP